MERVLDRFNAGFGPCFKNPKYDTYVFPSTKSNNIIKVLMLIPISGIVFAVIMGVAKPDSVGRKVVIARGVLGGIGLLPIVLLLDLVGIITQVIAVINAKKRKKEARNLLEARIAEYTRNTIPPTIRGTY